MFCLLTLSYVSLLKKKQKPECVDGLIIDQLNFREQFDSLWFNMQTKVTAINHLYGGKLAGLIINLNVIVCWHSYIFVAFRDSPFYQI